MTGSTKAWVGEERTKMEQSKQILAAVQSAQQILKGLKYECMCPGCYKQAIASHSQQKKGQLAAISIADHVYAIERNHLKQLASVFVKGDPCIPQMIKQHINEVTTYPGYCNFHDTNVFAAIEKRRLVKGDKDQVRVFHLRGLSYTNARQRYEMMHFGCVMETLQKQIGFIPPHPQYINWSIYVPADKRQLIDPCFKKAAKKDLRYVWRIIHKNIGVSCVSSVTLLDDQTADRLVGEATDYVRKELRHPRPFASLNVVPVGDVTHVIVAWHKRINGLVKEFAALLNSQDVGVFQHALNDVIFNRSEDYTVSPSVWEALTEETKRLFQKALMPEHIRGKLDYIPELIDLTGCVVE